MEGKVRRSFLTFFPKTIEDALEILKDGERLFEFISITLKGTHTWKRFRDICLEESILKIEALLEAIAQYPDDITNYLRKYKGDISSLLSNYIRSCINLWIYNKELEKCGFLNPCRRGVLIYWTNDGRLASIFFERINPNVLNVVKR